MLAAVDRWGDYLGLASRESRHKRREYEQRQAELITAWLESSSKR
jgi:hypothetical protein